MFDGCKSAWRGVLTLHGFDGRLHSTRWSVGHTTTSLTAKASISIPSFTYIIFQCQGLCLDRLLNGYRWLLNERVLSVKLFLSEGAWCPWTCMHKICMSVCSDIQCARTVGSKICNFDLENERMRNEILNRWPIFFCVWTRHAGCHGYILPPYACCHLHHYVLRPSVGGRQWARMRRFPLLGNLVIESLSPFFLF